MATFLMCPPIYYGVEYEINPWMSIRRQVQRDLAEMQWDALYRLLNMVLGCAIRIVEPVEGLPDMVFTANAGLVSGRHVVLSSFRHPQRQGEAAYFERWFEGNGYEVHTLPAGLVFEGAGDALFMGEDLFAGYRIRSDIQAHAWIGDLLRVRVLSLELVDERFYHLDTCFCPLDNHRAIYYPGAFDPYGQQVIRTHVAQPIPVSEADARRFACNAVVVDRHVVLQQGCEDLAKVLRGEGFEVHEVDLSEFIKAGGSAKCLTLRLD